MNQPNEHLLNNLLRHAPTMWPDGLTMDARKLVVAEAMSDVLDGMERAEARLAHTGITVTALLAQALRREALRFVCLAQPGEALNAVVLAGAVSQQGVSHDTYSQAQNVALSGLRDMGLIAETMPVYAWAVPGLPEFQLAPPWRSAVDGLVGRQVA